MIRFHQQIVFIFVLLVLQGKSFSQARRVKELTVVTTEKEVAVEGISNFSLQKEIIPNAAKIETSARIDGRKMSIETTAKTSNSKKVSMASSAGAVAASVRKRKGDEKENWKDNFRAFSADYRSPKPHPPKNN